MTRPDPTAIVCICLAALLAIVCAQLGRVVWAQETLARDVALTPRTRVSAARPSGGDSGTILAAVVQGSTSNRGAVDGPQKRRRDGDPGSSPGGGQPVSWRLLNAIAHVESRGNVHAVSRRGARGVYQLRPDTAAWCGVDAHDTPAARRCAARLLRLNLRRFGRLDAALAAYVFGAGNVQRYEAAGLPWPPAVERYVDRVLERAGMKS